VPQVVTHLLTLLSRSYIVQDALQEDFVECMLTSCVELVAHLFTDKPASAASTSGAPSGDLSLFLTW
jgi:hypothetical protein